MKKRKSLGVKVQGKLSTFIKKVESTLTVRTKILLGVLVAASLVFTVSSLFEENDVTKSSVRILSFTKNSGGSGVILNSSANESTVLTNAHVCRLVEKGATVVTNTREYLITGYKKSQFHDLCLVKVNNDLKINTSLAFIKPVPYYEKAIVSGHPNLLPNVVTSGHFSGTKIVSVIVDTKPCKEDDKSATCMWFGLKPVIKNFESTLVTATIMPGSSGSGVYNQNRNLVGLVFAGSGGLGYAWTVPYEYLVHFLNRESKFMEYKVPNMDEEGEAMQAPDIEDSLNKIQRVCEDRSHKMPEDVKSYCNAINRNILWIN